jgi:uncharacterized protein
MTLKEQIQEDFIAAMKARDELKKGALSMLKAAIMKWEVSGGEKKEATDEAVLEIMQREVKQRKDAAEGFRSGGNEEMAAKEDKEREILMAYMPEQMGEEEVREIVKGALDEAGISARADMGKAMGLVMGKLKGKADGGMINKVVASLLE